MRTIVFICGLMLSAAGLARAQTTGSVLTVTPALAVLGAELAPEHVSVAYIGPPEENASDWEPDPDALRQYQQADLVLAVGANYAGWLATTALPRTRLINTSSDFADAYIPQDGHGEPHRHGPDGAGHSHDGYANHFWLDPDLARQQAMKIAGAFQALWPDHAEEVSDNLERLNGALSGLDKALQIEFAALGEAKLFASHPVYQYLDRAYGLDLTSFHWEPDAHPAAESWRELDDMLAGDRPNLMIWEAAPLRETRDALNKRGVGIIVIYPSPANDPDAPLRVRLGFPEQIDPQTD